MPRIVMPKDQESVIAFRLPVALKDRAEQAAALRDETMSQALRRFLRDYIENTSVNLRPESRAGRGSPA